MLASAGYHESGTLQFDAAEAWSPDVFVAMALHEIGHALGLSHSNRRGGTMYPYATGATAIDAESRDALAVLYGWEDQRLVDDRATSSRAALGVTSVRASARSRVARVAALREPARGPSAGPAPVLLDRRAQLDDARPRGRVGRSHQRAVTVPR